MENMSHHNDHNDPVEDNPDFEQPLDIDDERSPQLDKVKCRCRCGCACNSSRSGNENTEDGGGGESDDGNSVDGEEGADIETEVGDMGFFNLQRLGLVVARHQRLIAADASRQHTCCCFIRPNGLRTPSSSMLVHLSPSQRSMSTPSLSQASTDGMSLDSSGFLFQAGGQFEPLAAPLMPGYHFTHTPIQLAPELEFSFPIGIALHYPSELEIESGTPHDFPAYDLW